ncbi:MAG: hypothetical protein M3Z54_03120 [Gemmatimonadota bacterium]|nr:hypothetical protein [Gemmatimonadota bacterium]
MAKDDFAIGRMKAEHANLETLKLPNLVFDFLKLFSIRYTSMIAQSLEKHVELIPIRDL